MWIAMYGGRFSCAWPPPVALVVSTAEPGVVAVNTLWFKSSFPVWDFNRYRIQPWISVDATELRVKWTRRVQPFKLRQFTLIQFLKGVGQYSCTRLFSLENMQIVNRGGHDQKVTRNDAVHDGGMWRRKRRARCARVFDARDEANASVNDRRVDVLPPRPLQVLRTT